MNRVRVYACALVLVLMIPLIGSIEPTTTNRLSEGHDAQLIADGDSNNIPTQTPMPVFGDLLWWEHTSLDSNRNQIHDSLENETGVVYVGLSYDHTPVS